MSNQVKRSAVNALAVEMILENKTLKRDLVDRWDAASKAGREITELHARIEQQLSTITRQNDEVWALKEELRLKREAVRFNSYDRLKLSWYETYRDVTGYLDLEPFGVKDDVLVDPMDGDKIPTIKLVRELTGLGLKEAKDIVDKWEADGKFKKWSAE